MSTPVQYRVEHRQPRRSTTLGVVTWGKPSWRSLDPYVSRLLHDGKTGCVVLVDGATGRVVRRRELARSTATVVPRASFPGP